MNISPSCLGNYLYLCTYSINSFTIQDFMSIAYFVINFSSICLICEFVKKIWIHTFLIVISLKFNLLNLVNISQIKYNISRRMFRLKSVGKVVFEKDGAQIGLFGDVRERVKSRPLTNYRDKVHEKYGYRNEEEQIDFGHDMLQEKYVDVRSIIEKCHSDCRRYTWSQEIF
ncbi:hypothetical protein V1478_010279 [Vespula squamosa]|uniref:Uncharacterized protein n=1 Tax=Vespula squamosa TaxID=30214 RepID=A0ABD2AHB4_VESSQ